jgi:5'-nucleotidase (lipoprotein e(P4) family)
MRAPALLLILCSTAACHTTAKPPAPGPPGATASRAGAGAGSTLPMPDSVHWLRNSAEYRAAVLQAYRQAAQAIDASAAGRAPGTWGVILDADETVLDNSTYQKAQAAQGLRFTAESWRAWTMRKAAPPVPGAVGFLRKVRAMGGVIAIVTNRAQGECADTEANLQQDGLLYDLILCQPTEAESAKEPRFERVARGTAKPGLAPVEVLLYVGDNIRDFPGLTPDIRDGPEAAFDPFGIRFIVLPNPMYGSWESRERK